MLAHCLHFLEREGKKHMILSHQVKRDRSTFTREFNRRWLLSFSSRSTWQKFIRLRAFARLKIMIIQICSFNKVSRLRCLLPGGDREEEKKGQVVNFSPIERSDDRVCSYSTPAEEEKEKQSFDLTRWYGEFTRVSHRLEHRWLWKNFSRSNRFWNQRVLVTESRARLIIFLRFPFVRDL